MRSTSHYCDATSQIELLCVAQFCGIKPNLLNFSPMGMTMTLAKSVIANRDQRIADLAHQIWEQEGRPEGRSEAHWLRAATLVDEAAPLAKKAPPKKPAAKKTGKK
jgi:hypothetical protein